MKKLCLFLIMCLISTKAMANIGVFPQAVDFFENGKKRSQTLSVVNSSNHPQTYRVSVVDYSQDENGRYHKVETIENSAKEYIMFSPKQFTLAPNKMQAIRIAKKGGGTMPDGEYVSHILVSEAIVQQPAPKPDENAAKDANMQEKKEVSVSISALLATSVPVTVYKGKDLSQSTEILEAKKTGDKLNLVLQRTGNISSRFFIKILDDKNDQIAQTGNIRIYTPNGKRNLSIAIKPDANPTKLELYDAVSKNKIMERNI